MYERLKAQEEDDKKKRSQAADHSKKEGTAAQGAIHAPSAQPNGVTVKPQIKHETMGGN